MKFLWMIILFPFSLAAERVLCLDEALLNKEIASILRSRGIEPDPFGVAQKRNIEERIMRLSCKKGYNSRISHTYLTRLREKKEMSIADLYALGFLFLQMGKPKEAKSFWHRVALQYPLTDTSEFKIKSALALAAQNSMPFALISMPRLQQSDDRGFLFLLPIRMSTLFSALVKG